MSNGQGEIDVFEELSGVAFEQTEKAPGGLGGMLGNVGSMFGPAGLAGGGFDFSSSAESRALSGGPFRSGDVTFGVKTNTLAIVAAVVFGLYLIGRKK